MASGFKRRRGEDEYVFIDGRMMRSDEVVRIELDDADAAAPGQTEAALVSGQDTAALVPGAAEAAKAGAGGFWAGRKGRSERKGRRGRGTAASGAAAVASADGKTSEAAGVGVDGAAAVFSAAADKPEGSFRRGLDALAQDDAFALTDDAQSGTISFERAADLMQDDKHTMRIKYGITFAICVVVALASMCMSRSHIGTTHAPWEVVLSIGAWFKLMCVQVMQPEHYISAYREVSAAMSYYEDCLTSVYMTFTLLLCGGLLAVAGMLYQNSFRNPIASPSMLGISNGINFALLILVLQFGTAAANYTQLYYLYAFAGGIGVLVLVLAGGKWISGKGRFTVVNMLLMGTVISQLLGVLMRYAQAYLLDEEAWAVYYNLQNVTTSVITDYSTAVMIIGALIALVPIVLFRFRLNLISFSDEETKLLGVNPDRLRILCLTCGSLMLLIAQLSAGQVTMISLIIPFVVRAVYGSEFRKQLTGNILVGTLVMVVCGVAGTWIRIDDDPLGSGMVVSLISIPLFVWMLAIQQRSWE